MLDNVSTIVNVKDPVQGPRPDRVSRISSEETFSCTLTDESPAPPRSSREEIIPMTPQPPHEELIPSLPGSHRAKDIVILATGPARR